MWKTCYPGAPDINWVSTNLACNSTGDLLKCGSADYGVAAEPCQSVGDFYCPEGAESWEKEVDVMETCQNACTNSGNEWFPGDLIGSGGPCCNPDDDFANDTHACDDEGKGYTCDLSNPDCGEISIDLGSGEVTHYCTSSGWEMASSSCSSCADEKSAVCSSCEDQTAEDDGIDFLKDSCCGDDSGEYLLHQECSSGCSTSENTQSCCSSSSSCVDSNGNCRATGYCTPDYDQSVDGVEVYCNQGVWTSDPDENLAACGCLGEGWDDSMNKCCDDDDDFIFNTDPAKACVSGSVESCSDSSGEVVYLGADPYTCVGGEWVAGSPDTDEGICTGLGHDWLAGASGTGSKCCQPGDHFKNSSTACVDGDTHTCGGDSFCEDTVSLDGTTYYCKTPDDEWITSSTHSITGDDGTVACCPESDDCVHEELCTRSGGSTCFDESTKADCNAGTWEETVCEGDYETDGGDDPFTYGEIYEAQECSVGSCTGGNVLKSDSCSDNTLTEVILDESSKTYDCSSFEGCWTGQAKYNTSTCSSGECDITNNDLTTSEYCTGCGKTWFTSLTPQRCCYGTSEFVGKGAESDNLCYGGELKTCQGTSCSPTYEFGNGQTYWCIDSSWISGDPDNYQGICGCKGFTWLGAGKCCESGDYLVGDDPTQACENGQVLQCSPEENRCESFSMGDNLIYCNETEWATEADSISVCSDACKNRGHEWYSGAKKCCYSETEGDIEDESKLCYSDSWLDASTSGPIVANDYLSDGSKWIICDQEGKTAYAESGTSYVCREGEGWESEDCALHGDDSQNYCENICSGDWVDHTEEPCCGNEAGDTYIISSTSICDGSSGVVSCSSENTCERVALDDEYYCFGGSWTTDPSFQGEFESFGGGSSGCCQQDQCWDGSACWDLGDVSGDAVCSSDGWVTCGENNLCASRVVGQTTFHCTDDGWSVATPELCQGMQGVCQNEECLLCGTDYEVGQFASGFMCTSSGVFSSNCLSDSDCPVTGECDIGRCESGTCVREPVSCGTPCSSGMCDGSGSCSSVGGQGSTCSCAAECEEGLTCRDGRCATVANAGDGVCDPGDCTGYPRDCSFDECKGDGLCTSADPINENCDNSPDCVCGSNKYCNIYADASDAWGCVISACGNDVCEPGECSYCKQDCEAIDCKGNNVCDLIVGENCDNSDDCDCRLNVSVTNAPTLRIGEEGTVRVQVVNDGNSPMGIDLDLDSDDFEIISQKQKVYVSPSEQREVLFRVKSRKTGSQKLKVLAQSSSGGGVQEKEIDMHVKELTAWENFINTLQSPFLYLKDTPLYGIYESFDVIFGIGAAIYAFFKIFIPKHRYARNYYPQNPGNTPRYYYGNQYHGTAYVQQGQQTRRGYYRF